MVSGNMFLKTIEKKDYQEIVVDSLDDLINYQLDEIGVVSYLDGDNIFSIETNIINLPLRYNSQLKKIVDDNKDYPLIKLAIVESEQVSESHMKMQIIGNQDQARNFFKALKS